MKENNIKIKNGIKLHLIKTNLFKTDFSVVFITIPLDRTTITKDVLIPEVLKSGSANYKKQIEISSKLDEMYGASLEAGTDKTGKNLVLKIYIESINDNFLPEKEENLKQSIDTLFDITFNPQVENDGFKKEYVNIEKDRRKLIIESEKDDKDTYSYNKLINIMYKDCGFGVNKNGYVEDLEQINEINLYERYKKIISEGKIDIFISGDIDDEKVKQYILDNEYIKKLEDRDEEKYLTNISQEEKEKIEEVQKVEEKMDVTQGKLVIGYDILEKVNPDDRFSALLFNTILGDGANSKLFRIVREKESLAYTTKSKYIMQKSNFIIKAGIEIENFDKTFNLISKQIEDIKNGEFTEEDLENAKRYVYAGIDSIKEEQNTAIIFYYGEEMSTNKITIEEYYEKIKNVKREDIIKIANRVQLNTIYFLRN